jgi:long-chain acyl-CoA synthetase
MDGSDYIPQYIALERLESIYKSSPLVSNLCVHGDSNAKQPIAIIIPHEGNLRHALKTSSTADLPAHNADLHEICASKAVEKMVLDSCNAAGKKSQFKGMEMLQAVVLTADEWTPENELVTAAQKIQRKKIAGKFEREIKVRFSSSSVFFLRGW